MRKAKILYLDLETSPNKAFTWGKWQQDVPAFQSEWYMLGFCAKWSGGKTISRVLPDYKSYKPGSEDDTAMVAELWSLMDEADVIIAHNGNSFDCKMANVRFLINGMPPPSPYQTVDTLKVARKHFRFNSNKLDDLGKTLKIGRKVQHSGFSLWVGCMDGDAKAWSTMRKYNKQDVTLLEKVYLTLRPYMTTHPNVSVISGIKDGCPSCGHMKLTKRGVRYRGTTISQRYQCSSCRSYSHGSYSKVSDIR
jgi:hypothetical protein